MLFTTLIAALATLSDSEDRERLSPAELQKRRASALRAAASQRPAYGLTTGPV